MRIAYVILAHQLPEQLVRRMAAWVREHGSRDPIEFAGNVEIDRNLPPSWVRGPQPAC